MTTSPATYGATVARMTHLDRWAVAGTGSIRGGRWTKLALHELDGSGRVLGEPALFEPMIGYSVPPALVGLKSRIVVFDVGSSLPGVVASTFTSPFAASPADEHEIFEYGGGFLRATPFCDNALVSSSGGDGALHLAAFDPFDGIVTARRVISPFPIALSLDHGTFLAASDGKGLVGVCAATGDPGDSPEADAPTAVKLFLFGPDLARLGLPIDVGEMDATAAGCEVGFSDDNVLVAWWDHRVPVIHVRAVRP